MNVFHDCTLSRIIFCRNQSLCLLYNVLYHFTDEGERRLENQRTETKETKRRVFRKHVDATSAQLHITLQSQRPQFDHDV